MKENLQSARSLYRFLSEQIYQKRMDIYSKAEAGHIAMMLMEHFLGQQRTDVLIDRQVTVDIKTENMLAAAIERLVNYEPIQYIIGETYFFDRAFYVSPSVLVPRRETEELTDMIIREHKGQEGLKILDVGTGSGCIAITLQKELSTPKVTAIDVSQEALSVAKANAARYEAEIEWIWEDVLHYKGEKKMYDIVVSNPPYVQELEAKAMNKNVLNYEPYSALFVKNDDPLIFYNKIAQLCVSQNMLKSGGKLFFEISEYFGKEVVSMLENHGFCHVSLRKDMQGRDRFVAGTLVF